MVFQRLRETLYFFWQHLTPLLVRLLPLLPLVAFANYRLRVVHNGDETAAMKDILLLAAELMASLVAMIITVRFTLAVVQKADSGFLPTWRGVLPALFPLGAVQFLAGMVVIAGPLLMLVPGLQILGLLLVLPSLWLLGALLPACVIVIQEQTGSIAALQAAWARFRPQAWAVSANLFALMLGLVVVLSGLQELGKLLETMPAALRVAADSGLELIGLLFSQMVAILLVRVYELEQQEPRKAGWN
jgi:hypothetical protein